MFSPILLFSLPLSKLAANCLFFSIRDFFFHLIFLNFVIFLSLFLVPIVSSVKQCQNLTWFYFCFYFVSQTFVLSNRKIFFGKPGCTVLGQKEVNFIWLTRIINWFDFTKEASQTENLSWAVILCACWYCIFSSELRYLSLVSVSLLSRNSGSL